MIQTVETLIFNEYCNYDKYIRYTGLFSPRFLFHPFTHQTFLPCFKLFQTRLLVIFCSSMIKRKTCPVLNSPTDIGGEGLEIFCLYCNNVNLQQSQQYIGGWGQFIIILDSISVDSRLFKAL